MLETPSLKDEKDMTREEKRTAIDWVNQNLVHLSNWHQVIWNYAEPAWREYKSATWYVSKLREEGFEVEECSGGMPTAFYAWWSNGDGPTIGSYAEYDAVPGFCQKAAPYKAPRDGFSPYAPGHTDPHSALGISQLGGLLAAKYAMEKHGIRGTLRFFGEPAEKVRGSKAVHAAKGYYDGVDAFICFHPAWAVPHVNTTAWETLCGVGFAKIYTFTYEKPQYRNLSIDNTLFSGAHTGRSAPGANDALMLMYQLSRSMQCYMLPFNSSWSLSEAILVGGQASSDNLPHNISQIQYLWRTPTVEEANRIDHVLDQHADYVAQITQTNVEKTWVTRSRPGLANHVMAELTYENVKLIGPPRWGEEARRIGQEIQRNLGYEPMDRPFPDVNEKLIEPWEAERILRQRLPEVQKSYTSDDYTEYTWHAPSARLFIASPSLSAPEGWDNPSWVKIALGGIPACIDPMIEVASKVIGATFIDLLTRPALLEKAWTEFNQRTGGGIGGDEWMAPLLPKDFKAPIDFRWPEYVNTARGEEWWIPT